MEIKLTYNPKNKMFYIYKDENLIINTISADVAIDEFLLYKNRADKQMNKIIQGYEEVSKLYLDTANNNFEMEV